MPQPAQTYKSHRRFYPIFHFFVLPVLTLNVLNTIRHVWSRAARDTWFELVMAITLLTLALTARAMAIAVQDRVIRLEMQLKLRALLPADLQGRIGELTQRQLVALRFAGDDELPSLVGEVLTGRLADQNAIKQRIKDWQADHLRA